MIYVDSSAVVKLARREDGTDALRAWIAAQSKQLVSSALARTESHRALVRDEPSALPVLGLLLTSIHQISISDRVLDTAASYPDPHLRSLDAIHLATAEALNPDLDAFVAYDRRLAELARTRGLPVVSPV